MEQRTANTVKLVTEAVIPGSSQFIEGRVGSGLGHFVLGGLAVAALAPTAPILAALVGIGVRANSFSNSISGRNLWSRNEHEEFTRPRTAAKPSGPVT